MTEIHDFLRVLYARVGTAHCPQCDSRLEAQPRDQIVERILAARLESILAARTYEAEKRQFDVGLRTSTDVLDAASKLGEDTAKSDEILVTESARAAIGELPDVSYSLIDDPIPGSAVNHRVRYPMWKPDP